MCTRLSCAAGPESCYDESSLFRGFPVSMALNPRIFVVDDEEAISMTMAAILKRSGFRVTWFTNPLESLAASFSERPDLLICDLMMPELSGIELAVQTQQVCPECRILLVSSVACSAHSMLSGAGVHPFDCLAKPVEPVLLIHEVRRRLCPPAGPERRD
jgi:DNA-binding response OmpR family regulator